ncbi:MAG: hypothetical protein V7K21_18710 [Nostoc sp.]|uniref:hypothetical protein n=1 Tax=Nostoc sp. TaxID=1180 RepID=UPI002FF9BC82
MTPVRSSRDTLSAAPPGGNPQDRTASPHGWLIHLGRPLQPFRHPTAGASLSQMGEDRSGSPMPHLNVRLSVVKDSRR